MFFNNNNRVPKMEFFQRKKCVILLNPLFSRNVLLQKTCGLCSHTIDSALRKFSIVLVSAARGAFQLQRYNVAKLYAILET